MIHSQQFRWKTLNLCKYEVYVADAAELCGATCGQLATLTYTCYSYKKLLKISKNIATSFLGFYQNVFLKKYFSKCFFFFLKMYFSRCISQNEFLKMYTSLWNLVRSQVKHLSASEATDMYFLCKNVFLKMYFSKLIFQNVYISLWEVKWSI